MIEKLNLGVVA